MSSVDVLALVDFLDSIDPTLSKAQITQRVVDEYELTRDRSVYSSDRFAIRFSTARSVSFANTVLSLSALQKYDDKPFIVVLCTPVGIHCLLANSTLLKKISHSSQEFRVNNIRGSFNGSDIIRELSGVPNNKSNLERLFAIHSAIGFEGNLPRLVEATNSISPTGKRFVPNENQRAFILKAPQRAQNFVDSENFQELKEDLDARVTRFKNEILLAGLIENVNIRGRVIEYLIAGEDELLRQELVSVLKGAEGNLPAFKTENSVGDYLRNFPKYRTATDVKTKIMILNSNPKAYNIDKMLEFLSDETSVFMFYFVGIDPMKIVDTLLISMFQEDLLASTILLKHWAGRNSRGVTQFEGSTIKKLILESNSEIHKTIAIEFLENLISIP
jgi:hypothetical protein